MLPTYSAADLIPLRIADNYDGTATAVYCLPRAVVWQARSWNEADEAAPLVVEHLTRPLAPDRWVVEVVEVDLVAVGPTQTLRALVYPVDAAGLPDAAERVCFTGVTSYEGVLLRLGFTADKGARKRVLAR